MSNNYRAPNLCTNYHHMSVCIRIVVSKHSLSVRSDNKSNAKAKGTILFRIREQKDISIVS